MRRIMQGEPFDIDALWHVVQSLVSRDDFVTAMAVVYQQPWGFLMIGHTLKCWWYSWRRRKYITVDIRRRESFHDKIVLYPHTSDTKRAAYYNVFPKRAEKAHCQQLKLRIRHATGRLPAYDPAYIIEMWPQSRLALYRVDTLSVDFLHLCTPVGDITVQKFAIDKALFELLGHEISENTPWEVLEPELLMAIMRR